MSVLNVYPTPITDAAALGFARQLERDCMTLALRLYGENVNTFAPETAAVMDRWRPRCAALLAGDIRIDREQDNQG